MLTWFLLPHGGPDDLGAVDAVLVPLGLHSVEQLPRHVLQLALLRRHELQRPRSPAHTHTHVYTHTHRVNREGEKRWLGILRNSSDRMGWDRHCSPDSFTSFTSGPSGDCVAKRSNDTPFR